MNSKFDYNTQQSVMQFLICTCPFHPFFRRSLHVASACSGKSAASVFACFQECPAILNPGRGGEDHLQVAGPCQRGDSPQPEPPLLWGRHPPAGGRGASRKRKGGQLYRGSRLNDTGTQNHPCNSDIPPITIYMRHKSQQPAVICPIPCLSCKMRGQWSDLIPQGYYVRMSVSHPVRSVRFVQVEPPGNRSVRVSK